MRRLLIVCLAVLASCSSADAAKPSSSPPAIAIADVTVNESAGNAVLTITKGRGKSYSQVSVTTVDGTAKAGSDYRPVSISLTMGNSQTSAQVTVPIVNDAVFEALETFTVTLKSVRNASIIRSPAIVTISDDDSAPVTPTPGLAAETAIADTFNTALGLQSAYGTGAIPPVSPDDVSGFRFMCEPGQLLYDDPVVFPGQVGASHLHQFWGNTGANANSTYSSLRTTGRSTCDNRGTDTPINRSAYWTPAMLDGAGNVVKPDFINTYYKQLPHSQCATAPSSTSMGICVDIPNGLRFVFGYNMANGKGGPLDLTSQDHYVMWFECWDDLIGTQNATAHGQFHSIAEVVSAGCPANAVLVMQGVIPICWDGKNLDSPDHRSHMAQLRGDIVPVRCPDSHPYVLPSLQMRLHYTTDANFVAGRWRLSSDAMAPSLPAGGTFHMDYFEAWSPTPKATWFRNCIDKHLTAANGDLCNGTQMKDAGWKDGGWTRHQLVTVP